MHNLGFPTSLLIILIVSNGIFLPVFAKGFTLAEVLITLGIIGIVAAMTIPDLLADISAKNTVNYFTVSFSLEYDINFIF